MQQHVTVLGALYIAFSALGIVGAIVIFIVVAGSGLISGDHTAIAVTALVGTFVAGFILCLSIPGLIGGIGLLYRKEWARILVIILGFLNLLNIPFGTILGIYTIWALMRPEMVQYFGDRAPSQPPPASAPL
jgi:hypothetical protein